MIDVAYLFRAGSAFAAIGLLALLAACDPQPPLVNREVLGLDATGRPVVAFDTCDRYGIQGTLGQCWHETPPVVWCYPSLANVDCYRMPDRLATREAAPVVDVPTLPTIYALPTPPEPPATEPPAAQP